MTTKKIMAAALVTIMLAGCSERYNQTGQIGKEDIGTLAGAGLGAWAGSSIGKGSGRTVAVVAGTLLGGALGKSIGSSLDKADMQYYNQTSQRALETAPSGQALPWTNPQTGNSGTITPTNYYQSNGSFCREYQQTITVGGRTERGYGTACRQPDGSWQVVN